MQHAKHWILIAGFMVLLWLPTADYFLHFDPTPRLEEKREPAVWPGWPQNREDIEAFPAAYDAYFKDHFGLRERLVLTYLNTKTWVFRSSPIDWGTIGKDGWLFLSGVSNVDTYRVHSPLTEADLEHRLADYQSQRAACLKQSALHLVVWGPNKSTIYPEYLPGWMTRLHDRTNLDALQEYVTQRSDIEMVDLRPALLRGKQDTRVYYRAESHWNTLGAYIAYRTILEHIGDRVPGIQVLTKDDVTFELRPRNQADTILPFAIPAYQAEWVEGATIKNPRSRFLGREIEGLDLKRDVDLLEYVSGDGLTGPTLLMFHDSFGYPMMPFLVETFARCVFVRRPSFNERIIEAVKPDVVIDLQVERKLLSGENLERYPGLGSW
ncbi:MAG: hypothetical protein GC168_08655 [Candidatus Hydrogenedens sp.]|nr:hypothetical protein [Candidatus Hydrogenedens sp.]